jgi:hypothetical protein
MPGRLNPLQVCDDDVACTLGCVSMLEIWEEALSEVHAGTLCSGSSSSPDSSELDLVYSMLDVSLAAWVWELALLSHP